MKSPSELISLLRSACDPYNHTEISYSEALGVLEYIDWLEDELESMCRASINVGSNMMLDSGRAEWYADRMQHKSLPRRRKK